MCDHVWIFEARTLSTQPVRRRCGMCGVYRMEPRCGEPGTSTCELRAGGRWPLRSTRGRLRIADRSQSSMSSAHCGPIMWVLDCAFALCRALVVLTFLAGFVTRPVSITGTAFLSRPALKHPSLQNCFQRVNEPERHFLIFLRFEVAWLKGRKQRCSSFQHNRLPQPRQRLRSGSRASADRNRERA
jgi:hypothetical protein